MPRPSSRAKVEAAIPTVEAVASELRADGAALQADAVDTVLDAARELLAAKERQARLDAKLAPTLSIRVPERVRTHLHAAAAEAGVDLSTVARRYMELFRDGAWTPPAPTRSARGTAPKKVFLNVRIPKDLADTVDALAKGPAAVEERGYPLNARQVALAGLIAEFPPPRDGTAG